MSEHSMSEQGMTDHIDTSGSIHSGDVHPGAATIASVLRDRAVQASAAQSELARKVGEINQHWLERIQAESTDAWQLLFQCGGTPAIGEKIKLCEQWIENAMKKAADDATYVLDSARALGELELQVLSPSGTACARSADGEGKSGSA